MVEWIAIAPAWLQAGGLAIACCAGWPSAAQTISATNPAGIADALEGMGYPAEMGTDGAGDPMITSEVAGVPYDIFFYGCTDAANCQSLLFSAGFDLANGIPVSRINDWNREGLVGAAFVDEENDPFLQLFVTTHGGLSRENFADVVEWWGVAVDEFTDHIGW